MMRFEEDYRKHEALKAAFDKAEADGNLDQMDRIRAEHEELTKEIAEKGKAYAHLYRRYEDAREAGNEKLDFNDVIWEKDIPDLVKTMKENGITEFTISSTFSSLIDTIVEFEKYGAKLLGTTTVKATYIDFRTGENEVHPAFKMSL